MTDLWTIALLLEMVLVAAVLTGCGWRSHPIFTAFAAYSLIASLLRLCSASLYDYVYYSTELLTVVLTIACTWELLSSLFLRPRGGKQFSCAIVFAAVLFGSISLTIIGPHYAMVLTAIDSAATAVCLVALMFSVVTARFFRIPWRRRSLGIALGFLAYLVPDTVVKVFLEFANPGLTGILNIIHVAAFVVAEITWIAYFLLRQEQKVVVSLSQLRCAVSIMESER